MRNPIKEKITDLKYAAKRLESECQDKGYEQSAVWIERAVCEIEKAIASADFVQSVTTIKKSS